MKPIRIFRHLVCQHPGYLGEYLQQRSIPWEMVCIDEEHPIPLRTDDVSAFVFMGAGVSVNDRLPWIDGELQLIRQAFDRDVPMMGVCFGAQLMSKALGGEINRGEGMEIGWLPIHRLAENDGEGWLDGVPERFTAFHWHADTYTLPQQCRHLLRSDCFTQQGFVVGDHFAMQFHLEMTREMVENWIERYGSDLLLDSACSQSAQMILQDLDQQIEQLHKISDLIYGRWLQRVLARQDTT
ncbi:MAG: type 1 glutamine amidotransferase [Candidatus Thiodiazotropha sp. (ex Dulcina madagascariensis)]|nr:type 1 glutamine amidotransferase [Candidatus Thiodiazotropha sp. (ex Dulcina madagascariensis)]